MNQNKLQFRYSDYVNASQQTEINKIFWRDYSSLPYHVVFKDLQKRAIYYWISLRLVKVSCLEIKDI